MKCPKCNSELQVRGKITSKEEIIKTYYCKNCDKFYNATYDIMFRCIEEINLPRR